MGGTVTPKLLEEGGANRVATNPCVPSLAAWHTSCVCEELPSVFMLTCKLNANDFFQVHR